jgi:peptide/nickel transport system permease protein
VVGYLIRRIFQAIVVTFIVTLFTLALVHLLPGGPVRGLLGPRATFQQVRYYTHLYGFDQPIWVQYGKWVWQLLQGNLGYSPKNNQYVTSEIAEFLPKTIVLVLLGTIVSLLFGIPLGIYQAVKRYTPGDYALTGLSFVGYATPTFFVGLLLVQWFAVDAHIFPPFAPQPSPGQPLTVLDVLSQPQALVLPVIAYAFVLYALWSRYMRSSVMDNLVQDYVRTARAKGASERRVLWGHVFRNSLTAIITLLGLSLPTLVAGAIFVEVVFNYPGMGLAFFNAATNFDFPTLLGFTIIATLATILGNLLADVSYAVIDPRVRYS